MGGRVIENDGSKAAHRSHQPTADGGGLGGWRVGGLCGVEQEPESISVLLTVGGLCGWVGDGGG